MILTVDTAAGELSWEGQRAPCRIGRSGACPAESKREGDGCTPLGRWPFRAALLRPDAGLVPPAALPWRWLRRDDGWSDDPADPAYNRAVSHPHPWSAERLWRADRAYDALLVVGHNDCPPCPSLGSAVFLHLSTDQATEGCVSVSRETMVDLLAILQVGDLLRVG